MFRNQRTKTFSEIPEVLPPQLDHHALRPLDYRSRPSARPWAGVGTDQWADRR